MALAGRAPRRGKTGRWWLLAGLIATLLVLLVDASYKSRDPGPQRTLAADTWVDRVVPVIGNSTSQGVQLAQLRVNGSGMTAAELDAQYQQVSQAASQSLATVKGLRPPSQLAEANGFVTACLQSRAQAASGIWQAVHQYLMSPAGTDPSAAVSAFTAAVSQFGVSNQAYQLFQKAMTSMHVALPASSWNAAPSSYTAPALTAFLTGIHNAGGLVSAPDLAVLAVSTNPPALSANGSTQVLSPASSLSVTATVANQGNVVENNVAVTAAISASAAPPPSVSHAVTLQPGQKQTVTLGPLHPPVGPAFSLTVSVPVAPGETVTTNNTVVLTLQMVSGAGAPGAG